MDYSEFHPCIQLRANQQEEKRRAGWCVGNSECKVKCLIHMYIFGLYGGRLSQPKHFCISPVICKTQFSKKKNPFPGYEFKCFLLVYYHAEMDLTHTSDKVITITRGTHGSFTLYYHLYSIDISLAMCLTCLWVTAQHVTHTCFICYIILLMMENCLTCPTYV